MAEINLNNTSTTDSGNLIFSGISSGIDSQSVINAIITSKRAQAVQIEGNIATNNDKLTAFGEMKTLATTFRDTLDNLRGSTSFFSTDVFDSKLAFTNSKVAATAAPGHVASEATEIMGVTVSDKAVKGSHVVEVVTLAKAQQLRGDAFASKTDDLSTLGVTMGDFTLNGKSVNVSAGDSLVDLRDKINATNTGATASNVNASIVSVSDTEHYLVLSSSETGTDNAITFGGTQGVHNSLGLTSVGTDTVKTEITAADNAVIRVDGLGIDITRQSNTISDVIEGVTLDLFKAEEGTEIDIDIDLDLNTIKTTVVDFMNAYNDLKAFTIDQRSEVVRTEGGDKEYGALAFDTTLRQIESKLSELVALDVPGLENGFSSLSQVGININDDFLLEMDDAVFDDKILNNADAIRKLFTFDVSTSDSRVVVSGHTNNTSYTVDGSNVPEPYYLNIGGTDINGDIISANIQTIAASGSGGAGDGSVTKVGNSITATDITAADGLQVFFNGSPSLAPIDDIEISFTRGVADMLFTFFDDVVKSDGQIDGITSSLVDQNVDYEQRITDIDSRLDIQRASLNAKFLAMETSVMRLNGIKDQLKQMSDAMNSDG